MVKGKYHKVSHGMRLLEKPDADRLEKHSSEFAALIRKLRD